MIIKKIPLILISGLLPALLLLSCNNNGDTSDAYGNFEATEVVVSAEVSGRILSFPFEEGQLMEEGALVAEIDSTDLRLKRSQLAAAKNSVLSGLPGLDAQIAVYQQQQINLRKDENRIRKMLEANAATQKQLDDITGNISVIDRQISAVKAQKGSITEQSTVYDEQISQVEESLRKCKIYSPLQGTILVKYVEEGELAIQGRPLFRIADLSTVFLRVYVDGQQLSGLKTGQEVRIMVNQEGGVLKEMKGILSWISPEAEFTPKIIQTRKERVNMVYAVKIMVKNDGSLKIGMPGEVLFN